MQEFTCVLCGAGFIEELPPNGSSDRSRSTSSDDVEIPGEFENHRLNERISSLLMSSIGGGLRAMDEDSDHSSNQDGSSSSMFNLNSLCFFPIFFFSFILNKHHIYYQLGGQRARGRSRSLRGRRSHDMPNFENIMQEFLISISVY